MTLKRFPWRIFWLSLIAQWAVFHGLYGIYGLVFHYEWDTAFVFLGTAASVLSTFIFIRPVYLLTISLKNQKADLHREREETQALLGAIQEAVVNFGLDQRLLFFNNRFASLFLGSEAHDRVRHFRNVFSEPRLLTAVDQVLQQGRPQFLQVDLPTLLDTQPRFFNVSVTPVRKKKNDELYEVVCVFHDITDIKKAEQIRIDFVGNASHELRTPLTSIKGYVETLREDIQNKRYDQTEKFISVVSRNVDRLIDLVNDLLNLSKMESGSELRLQIFSPHLVTQNVIADLALLAQEKSILMRSHCTVAEMKGDTQKIEQVLRNLISNAIKYIPEGQEIQVRWEKVESEVVLRVMDTGPGIPEEHHARLFERFYRIDKGRARETGGTGLGLAIVKHIMQGHGGTIEVRSKHGQGSEFICHFPHALGSIEAGAASSVPGSLGSSS
jgi:two-component system phosphate regulon sensor histidine kinase PhoR